jgi:hypothetical protein
MENNKQFESEVLALLRRFSAKKEQIQAQYSRELAEIDRKIEAIQITAQELRQSAATDAKTELSSDEFVIPPGLRGKNVREACIEIAKQNHGLLKISPASKALVDFGVIQKRKHAWGATYTTCVRSKEFEKDSKTPGTFKLISWREPEGFQQPLSSARPM